MATTLEIDHKEMHDIKSAAEQSGYSRDHVATLARSGKIVAAQIDRHWYVDLESLMQYAHITSLEQRIKQKHLSEERRSARDLTDSLKKQKQKKKQHQVAYQKNLHTSLAGFLLFFGVVGSMLGYYAPEFLAFTNNQLASATGISSQSEPAIDVSVFESDEEVIERTVFGDGVVQVSVLAEPNEAIVLLPEELGREEVFSDDVEIVEEDGQTVLLVQDGEAVRRVEAVTVPISERKIP